MIRRREHQRNRPRTSAEARIRRGTALGLAAALCALIAQIAPQALAKSTTNKLSASTGRATHVLDTSALLTAVVSPNGTPTSYYFQWGTTTGYGTQTPTVNVGSGTTKVKVGQSISGLQSNVTYHFRVVAVAGASTFVGKDHTFIAGKHKLKFVLPKSADVLVGAPFTLSGTLTGLGNAAHQVVLQASPYPYREAFKTIGAPILTDPTGGFAFHVPPLATSTEYRVITLDLRPLFSRTEVVHAALDIVLHVRTSRQPGLVRLYGTVRPAQVGAQVLLQVHEAPKAGTGKPGAEPKAKFVSQFVTVVKKAGKTFSRFSVVAKVRIPGRYRAAVKVKRAGPLVSGYSPTVVLRADPNAHPKKTKK